MTRRAKVQDGGLLFEEPLALPEGTEVEVEIGALLSPESPPDRTDVAMLSELPFFGMWADREEMADSAAWVRRQREQRQQRLS